MATSNVAPPQHSSEKQAGWPSRELNSGPDLTRSIVRRRVASRLWWASRIVVSVTSTFVCSPSHLASASGPCESRIDLALGSGLASASLAGAGTSMLPAGALPL